MKKEKEAANSTDEIKGTKRVKRKFGNTARAVSPEPQASAGSKLTVDFGWSTFESARTPELIAPVVNVSKRASVSLIADTGATRTLLSASAFDKHAQDLQEPPPIELRSASGDQLSLDKLGVLSAEAKNERGLYANCPITSVYRCSDMQTGKHDGLLSIFELVQQGAVAHFAPQSQGGSWLLLKDSVQQMPLLVKDRQFVLELALNRTRALDRTLTHAEKQQHNFEMHLLTGHAGHRRLSETFQAQAGH